MSFLETGLRAIFPTLPPYFRHKFVLKLLILLLYMEVNTRFSIEVYAEQPILQETVNVKHFDNHNKHCLSGTILVFCFSVVVRCKLPSVYKEGVMQ